MLAVFEPIILSDSKWFKPLVIPWVVIRETSSLELTLVMDAQTSTGVRVVHKLMGKVYNLCRVKSIWIAISAVKDTLRCGHND